MKKIFITIFTACMFLAANAQQIVNMQINGSSAKDTISRFIYGHFAEHLGRCIYDGFYLEDSSLNVPKKGRIRMDVVDALKAINLPLL